MSNPLVDHGISKVWCEPIQDHQHLIAGARLTGVGGAFLKLLVGYDNIPLPITSNRLRRYHVYQLGLIQLGNFDINIATNVWTNVATIMQQDSVVIDAYLSSGAMIPKAICWMIRLYNGNLLMAVEHHSGLSYGRLTISTGAVGIIQPDSDMVYFRFYRNARYDSSDWLSTPLPFNPIKVVSRFIYSINDYVSFMDEVANVVSQYSGFGQEVYYCDGFKVNAPLGFDTYYLNRHLQLVWDESIKAVQSFPLASCKSFVSELDLNVTKYLLLTDRAYDEIDYIDDIDLYLVNSAGVGVLVHRALPSAMRMIAHNAYSVSTSLIASYTLLNDHFLDLGSCSLTLVIRQGGMINGVSPQANRIEDLYRLSYDEILSAMSGQPNIHGWSAATLEKSAYVKLMSLPINDINAKVVSDAYGYHTVNQVLYPVQLPVVFSEVVTPTSYVRRTGFWGNAKRTIASYNADGHLLNHETYTHGSTVHALSNPLTSHVEVIPLGVGDSLYCGVDLNNDPRLAAYEYRCYLCNLVNGVPSEDWIDVTGSEYYTVRKVGQDSHLSLLWDTVGLAQANQYMAVKINDVMGVSTVTLNPSNSAALNFTIGAIYTWIDGTYLRPVTIAPAVVDAFMDGVPLIPEIDFKVIWPKVYILRKPTNWTAGCTITVRYYGFCNPATGRPYPPREVGFVRGGLLSVDGVFNTRNNRLTRVLVGGQYKRLSDVRCAEDGTGALSTDGRPYALTDYIFPVEGFSPLNTTAAYHESTLIDEQVDSYLTSRLPMANPIYQFIDGDRWVLYSPFASAVLKFVKLGGVTLSQLRGSYTRTDTDAWLVNHLPLLAADPCTALPLSSHDFVSVHVHPFNDVQTVTFDQYRFLDFVVRNYLNNLTDLSPSVIVE